MRPCLFLSAFEPASMKVLSVSLFQPFANMIELRLHRVRCKRRLHFQQVLFECIQAVLLVHLQKLLGCKVLVGFHYAQGLLLSDRLLLCLLVRTIKVFWGLATAICSALSLLCPAHFRMYIVEVRSLVLRFFCYLMLQLGFSCCVNQARFCASTALLDIAHIFTKLVQKLYFNAVKLLILSFEVALMSFANLYLCLKVGDMLASRVSLRI